MKKRMGQISHKPDYSVLVRYSKNAIENNLIKFITKKGETFEVQLGEMIDLLSKFVSSEVLAPTLMDNKVVNMIKVQRALQFIPNKDIKAGELVNIPFEHMMPVEYAIAEEALGVSKMTDTIKTINQKQIEQAGKRVDSAVMEFSKAAYESMIRKYQEQNKKEDKTEESGNQEET